MDLSQLHQEVPEGGSRRIWEIFNWIIRGSNIALPFSDKLKVHPIHLSDESFISTIEDSLEKSCTRYIPIEQSDGYYPCDYLLSKFASRVYKEQTKCSEKLEKDWILLTYASFADGIVGDGYFGAAYYNPKLLQVIVAHKGTNNAKDLWTDYQGILSEKYTSQMSSAATFSNIIAGTVKILREKYSANLTLSFTGHSLGGWLAQVTAFTAQYLSFKSFKDKGVCFVKSNEDFHTHTVVFDSPGCRNMLLTIESDFNVRYGVETNLSFLLDVTIYLSAPNLVNIIHSHLNVGNLFRVFIENLPANAMSGGLIEYTSATHSIDKIIEVFASKGKIMRIIDWPLVKEGLEGMIIKKLYRTFTFDKSEYSRFHALANAKNSYDIPPDGNNDYFTYCYQVQNVEENKCSANIFTLPELEFLKKHLMLRKFLMPYVLADFLSYRYENTKGEISATLIIDILQDFEIEDQNGQFNIICDNKKLQKLIICVKTLLFLSPNLRNDFKYLSTLIYRNTLSAFEWYHSE